MLYRTFAIRAGPQSTLTKPGQYRTVAGLVSMGLLGEVKTQTE